MPFRAAIDRIAASDLFVVGLFPATEFFDFPDCRWLIVRSHIRLRVDTVRGCYDESQHKSMARLAVLAIVMGLLLFVPAGTVHYWHAWVYLWIFTGTSILTTVYLMRQDPALLERRMRAVRRRKSDQRKSSSCCVRQSDS